MNPFYGLKSEDEDEEPVVADSQEDEEEEEENVEVDEAELEALLDRQLADGLPLGQDGLRFPGDNQENDTFSVPSSKSEEALRTRKSFSSAGRFVLLAACEMTSPLCPSGLAEAGCVHSHAEHGGRAEQAGRRRARERRGVLGYG